MSLVGIPSQRPNTYPGLSEKTVEFDRKELLTLPGGGHMRRAENHEISDPDLNNPDMLTLTYVGFEPYRYYLGNSIERKPVWYGVIMPLNERARRFHTIVTVDPSYDGTGIEARIAYALAHRAHESFDATSVTAMAHDLGDADHLGNVGFHLKGAEPDAPFISGMYVIDFEPEQARIG